MAREFQRAMEDAADDAGVKDIGRDLKGYSNPKKYGLDKLNEAASSFEKWDPMKEPRKTDSKKGPATQALSEERREKSERFKKAAADRAQSRLDREAETTSADTGPVAQPDPAAPAEEPKE